MPAPSPHNPTADPVVKTLSQAVTITRSLNAAPTGAAEVFLSPRVLDTRAFDEYASRLRAMAHETDTKAAALAELIDRAQSAAQTGAESARRHAAAVPALTRLLQALGERTREVEHLLGRAEQRLIQVNDATDAALHRLDDAAAGHPLAQLTDDAERVKDQLTLASRRVGELKEHASELIESLAAHAAEARLAQEKSDEASERLESATRQAAAHAAAAAAATRALAAMLADAQKARDAAGSVARDLGALLSRAQDARADLDAWRALLCPADHVAADRPATLPGPLQRIADEFRAVISQDLAKMAGAMNLIAHGARASVKMNAGAPEIVIRAASSPELSRPGSD